MQSASRHTFNALFCTGHDSAGFRHCQRRSSRREYKRDSSSSNSEIKITSQMISTPTLHFTLLLVFAAIYFCIRERRKTRALPPGPRRYPIIGNVFDIPHEYAWLTYAEWAKTYGDVISTSVFGTTTVVLNSLKATTELLDKRSANYSDRPRMVCHI